MATSEEAVRGSDVINAATNSLVPVIRQEWVEEGAYIAPVKDYAELEVATLKEADVLVSTTPWPQWNYYGIGGLDGFPEHERQYWGRAPGIAWDRIPLLAEVLAGTAEGRTSNAQIVVLLNKGHGLQFAAVGHRVFQLAREKSLGTEVDTNLYLQDRKYIP